MFSTILVRFEGYTGRYVFHCHMLEHEDNDMMRPYEVVPVVSDVAARRLLPKWIDSAARRDCTIRK